jgi:hypothetical protein
MESYSQRALRIAQQRQMQESHNESYMIQNQIPTET